MFDVRKSVGMSLSILLTAVQAFLAPLSALAAPPQPAFATTSACAVEDVIDANVFGRAFSVTFPDGREITIVGHAHGARDIPLRVFNLANTDARSLSTREFVGQLDAIVSTDADFIVHAKEDYAFLRNLLRTRSDVRVIGVEALDREWNDIRTDSRNLDRVLRAAMLQRRIPITPKIENSLRAISGTPVALELGEGDLLRGREIRGMETDAGLAGEAMAIQNSDAKRAALLQLLSSEPELSEAVEGTRYQLVERFSTYDPRSHDAQIVEAVERALPLKYRAAGRDWIQSELRLLAIRKNRDVEVARNLVRQGQNVVHLVGQNHRPSLLHQLVGLCKNEEKIAPLKPVRRLEPAYVRR